MKYEKPPREDVKEYMSEKFRVNKGNSLWICYVIVET